MHRASVLSGNTAVVVKKTSFCNASASKHAKCVVKDKSISVPGPKLLHTTDFTLVAAFVFAGIIEKKSKQSKTKQ